MRVERIADSRSAPAVLRAVAGATSRLGLPPPAALSGDWFGSRAVIAPSVAIDALATSPAPAPWQVEWTAPDRDVHHAGVLACLEEIRAGEVYQACVCTQF